PSGSYLSQRALQALFDDRERWSDQMTTGHDALELSGGVLSREQLRSLTEGSGKPLLEGYLDLETQLQPNGFDMTLREVSRYVNRGQIGRDNADRVLSELVPLEFDAVGWVTLEPGVYHIVYNEIVSLPESLMALGRPRSSLGR